MAEPPTLNILPDLCLLNTFESIPIGDLIRNIGPQSHRFQGLSLVELGRRRTLVLFEPFEFEPVQLDENPFIIPEIAHVRNDNGTPFITIRPDAQIEIDVLRLQQDLMLAHRRFSQRITRILPNITHLTVLREWIPGGNAFAQLILLLNHYGPRLISLRLTFRNTYSQFNQARPDEMFVPLVEAINRMQSLRHLTLNVDLFGLTRLAQPRLTILAGLDTFNFYCKEFHQITWVAESIREHANDHVRIVSDLSIPSTDLLQYNAQLAQRFTRVRANFEDFPNNVTLFNNVQQFCTHYSTLVSLAMEFSKLPLYTLARCLSQLRQLVYLEFTFKKFSARENYRIPMQINPVTSVRCLKIDVETRSHHYMEQLPTAQLFPNIQVLLFHQEPIKCADCEYNIDQVVSVMRRNTGTPVRTRIDQCMRLTRQPLRACVNVHTVKLTTGDFLEHLVPDGLITIDQL